MTGRFDRIVSTVGVKRFGANRSPSSGGVATCVSRMGFCTSSSKTILVRSAARRRERLERAIDATPSPSTCAQKKALEGILPKSGQLHVRQDRKRPSFGVCLPRSWSCPTAFVDVVRVAQRGYIRMDQAHGTSGRAPAMINSSPRQRRSGSTWRTCPGRRWRAHGQARRPTSGQTSRARIAPRRLAAVTGPFDGQWRLGARASAAV